MIICLIQLILILLTVSLDSHTFAHGISESEKQTILNGGNLQFLKIGATHMLTGYDHLLFVFGIVFYFNNFLDVIKYVTAFTIGHSITLITATLKGIALNYYLIDALIALSVCYIGYENIGGFWKLFKKTPNLIGVIFLFGLIHGLGLSTRLQQLPLGDNGLIFRILHFNLGVELGQLGALFLIVGLLIKWRKTKPFSQIRNIANNGLIFAGFLLFLIQMHGYLHNTYPNDFGLSEDNHVHSHEKMSHKSSLPGSEYMVSPDIDYLMRENK